MSEKDASLSAMTDQLHSLKEGLEEEEQRLSDRKAELAAWEQEQEAEYNKRFSDLMNRENKLDVRINEYKEEKAEFEEERNRGTLADENKELKNKVEQLSIENGKGNSQVQNLEHKVENLENDLKDAQNTIERLRSEISSLENTRDDLKKELAKEHGIHSGF